MRKYIVIIVMFILIVQNFIFASEDTPDIVSQALKSFKARQYGDMYEYFYLPPYYNQRDVKNDRERFAQALNNFAEVLGELEQYSEIPFSEYKSECLGSICGVSESGIYEVSFVPSENGPVYLKTYKADFSKVKSIYMYLFVLPWQGKQQITQFGISMPSQLLENMDAEFPLGGDPGVGGGIIMALYELNNSLTCEKYPELKAKVLADRVGNNEGNVPGEVEYDLMTKEGQPLLLKVTYPTYSNEESVPQNTLLELPGNVTPFAGERVYHLVTTKNEEITVSISCSDDKEVQSISVMPPKRAGDYSEELFVKSQGGFLISITAGWKNGAMESFSIGPWIHPFKSIAYISCPKTE